MTAGYRYFKCKCGCKWHGPTGKCESMEVDFCPMCGADCAPIKASARPEWPVDEEGKLI